MISKTWVVVLVGCCRDLFVRSVVAIVFELADLVSFLFFFSFSEIFLEKPPKRGKREGE